jgi:L-threonylcarbamoyladenylate synthase
MHLQIQKASNILQNGGVVIFPTDTVYGIGCRLDDEEAIKRVYKIRNRPEEKAVLAVVDSVTMAKEYVQISKDVHSQLIEKYWPGGLTIILPCNVDKVPSSARAGGATLAVRQTNHPVLVQLIKESGVPIIAPSANFAGEKTPTSFTELDPKLCSLVDYVVEGECGGNMPSTIIDCSVKPWKIMREGAVKIDL